MAGEQKKREFAPIRLYVMIRRCADDDREFPDLESLSLLSQTTQHRAAELDKRIPFWSKDNPSQRVVECTLTIKEDGK